MVPRFSGGRIAFSSLVVGFLSLKLGCSSMFKCVPFREVMILFVRPLSYPQNIFCFI